jgi:hypothetical protein
MASRISPEHTPRSPARVAQARYIAKRKHLFQARIEGIAQPIPEQVEA